MLIHRSSVIHHHALTRAAACVVGAALACSAPLDETDETSPPPFGGTINSVTGAPSGLNPVGNQNPSGPVGSGQTGEGQPNGAPLAPGAATSPAGGNQGAGGSAAIISQEPGAGGSAMAAAGQAGAGSGGADGSSMLEPVPSPPVDPPPVIPPPVNPPPPEEPPLEGLGCAPGSAFFCEDFEAFNVGPAQANAAWTPQTSNGSLSIDSQLAIGTRSLQVQTQGNGRAYILLASFAPPGNSFFARMYLQAEAFPSAPDYAHFTLVEAAGVGAGLIRPIGGQYIPGEGTLWGAGSDQGPTGDWTNWRPTAPTEAGRWLCIEWEMSSADNNINVWIDGVAKPEMSVSTNSHGGNNVPFIFPQLNRMWIGWELYQGGPTPNQFNFHFDDIVLSTQRVGC